MSDGSVRTYDLLPGIPIRVPTMGGADTYDNADRLLDMTLNNQTLTQERDHLASRLVEANGLNGRLSKALHETPSMSTTQSMLNEANSSAVNASNQRDQLLQQLQGAEIRIGELDRFLLNMQRMAAHVKTRHDEVEHQRDHAISTNEKLTTDLTRMTERVADLTRAVASGFSQAQHDEATQRAAERFQAQLAETRLEAQTFHKAAQLENKDASGRTRHTPPERGRLREATKRGRRHCPTAVGQALRRTGGSKAS
jgi:chromosome segregation ATPase